LRGKQSSEAAGLSVVGQQHGRAARHLVELRSVGRVGHNELGFAATLGSDAMLDGCWTEGREQRLIDCARPPGAQHNYEQLGDARQQPCNGVATTNAIPAQQIGKTR